MTSHLTGTMSIHVRGTTLIELMIALAIVALLLAIGYPNLTQYLQNAQVRGAAEATVSGVQLARSEAIRRNTFVRLTLTTTLDGACASSAAGTNWVVSRNSPDGACDVDPVVDFVDPNDGTVQILQKRASAEGSPNAVIASADDAGTGRPTIIFNGLGRIQGAAGINRVDINVTNPTGGACVATGLGPVRCLRVSVSIAGDVKLCDPAVVAPDPRTCPN